MRAYKYRAYAQTALAGVLLAGVASMAGVAKAEAPTETVSVAEVVDAAVDAVVVTAKRNSIPNLKEIAGSASVITADQVESGRVANIADALRYQPGLLAQSATGTEATRFSMRGSGIIRGPSSWGTGIQMLFDGLPLTTPEGSPYEYYEALANNYIEVFRGANAFDYSPTTQGGAINYVPHTGYNATPLLARVEFGSFGYQRQQVSSGQRIGAFDYYVSATHYQTNGFRQRNRSFSQRLLGDFGYTNGPLKTRFYIEYAQQNTANASSLTLAQIALDPTINTTTSGNRRDVGSSLLANKTTYQIDDKSDLSFGALYKNFPLRNQGGSFPGFWDVKDLSTALRYHRRDTIAGHESDTLVAVLYSTVLPKSRNRAFNATLTKQVQEAIFKGFDTTLLIRNDFEALPGLKLTTGIAAITQMRKSSVILPINLPASQNPSQSEHYNQLAPRIGLRYEPRPDFQLFGNVTRSVEAPIAHQLTVTTANIYSGNYDVRQQTQNTFEIGGRGEWGPLHWNLAAYYAKIKREILTIQIAPATATTAAVTQTNNAKSPTIHKGIEANLDATLWKKDGTTLVLHQALTINRFHYENDPIFGKNVLPAVPKELYQAGLDFNHASGFYAGVDVEAALSRYPADFANTLFAPSYAIFGAKIGWQAPDKAWQVFAEVRNIADKKYVAVVSPTFNAKGLDSAVFSPGVGRNFTVGLTHAFF